jgi:precorrin-2 C(20)-methyltransferase
MNGKLFGIGMGPGDPELVTLKALRLLQAADIIAYPTARAGYGNVLSTVQPHLLSGQQLYPLVYPATASEADEPYYEQVMLEFYDRTAEEIASYLKASKNVAIPCAGDPFFFGSYMYWHKRLVGHFVTEVVPGISSIMAAPVAALKPWCHRNDTVSVIPGTLPLESIIAQLKTSDAAVIIKLGRTFAKVSEALKVTGLLEKSIYVERASMDQERVLVAGDVNPETVPYFSVVFVPTKV